MFLTTKGRYAVMALLDLLSDSSNAPIRLSDIAIRQEIDVSYLEQIFAKLKLEGIVKASRGPGGGYQIALDPNEISILSIMNAVEEQFKMTRCTAKNSDGCMQDKSRCLSHHLWEALEDRIADFFASITLHDVKYNRLKKRVENG